MVWACCPKCEHSFELPGGSKRVCFDCKKPIGHHGKYTQKVRNGVPTIVHRDCNVPNGGPGFKG